jgi:hypothetical protein
MRGILISTLNTTSIYERAYERHPRKHDNTIFLCVLMRGILISTLILAYMSVLMRHKNKGFS